MKDRIEMTYEAIDEMIASHGKERPEKFGGGTWSATQEFIIYKDQVGNRYTKFQWSMIEAYFKNKFKEIKK